MMKLTWKEQLVLRAYQVGMHLFLPLGILLGLPWLLLKTKRRRTVFRRLGFQRVGLAQGGLRPLWVHALSLGETLSCVTLVKALRERVGQRPIVFTVSTLAAKEMASERLGAVVDRILYFPFDLLPSIWRMLWGLHPAMLVVVETDIWPGFQRCVARRGIPSVLANARLSPQSFDACRRFQSLFAPALNGFTTIYPQSTGEGERYREVGVLEDRLGQVGNLKFDAAITVEDLSEKRRWARESCGLVESDEVWLAGSTHPGEERAVLEVHRRLRKEHPGLRLILVPRQPRRGEEVLNLTREMGLEGRCWTGGRPARAPDVFLVDVLGQLAGLYPAADMAFVGGSLVRKGGQNPLEPAASGLPVLFGPDMSDFPDIAAELLQRRAAFTVLNEEQLCRRLQQLLREPELGKQMGLQGRRFIMEHRGTTQRVADEVAKQLAASSF